MKANMMPAQQKKLHRLCVAIEVILLLLLVTFPIVSCSWLFIPFLVVSEDGQLQDGVLSIAEILDIILDTLVIFLVLLQMLIFVRGVRRGELFTSKQVRTVRNTGLIFMSGYFLNLAVRTLPNTPFGEDLSYDSLTLASIELYSIRQFLLGIGLFAMSCILEKARVINDEQKLII